MIADELRLAGFTGRRPGSVARLKLTYDVGPAGLKPAKPGLPGRDAANHSSSDFCPTS